MFETCTLAVFTEMNSSRPISRLVRPERDEAEDLDLAVGQAERFTRPARRLVRAGPLEQQIEAREQWERTGTRRDLACGARDLARAEPVAGVQQGPRHLRARFGRAHHALDLVERARGGRPVLEPRRPGRGRCPRTRDCTPRHRVGDFSCAAHDEASGARGPSRGIDALRRIDRGAGTERAEAHRARGRARFRHVDPAFGQLDRVAEARTCEPEFDLGGHARDLVRDVAGRIAAGVDQKLLDRVVIALAERELGPRQGFVGPSARPTQPRRLIEHLLGVVPIAE